LLALLLVGDFSLPDVCWKYNIAERKQSRRFLEGLVGGVVVRSRLGRSDHEMTEFSVLDGVRRGGQQNPHHGLLEGRVWLVQDTG